MTTSKSISPFRLSSLLRSQKDPLLAFKLFLNPNPNPNPNPNKPQNRPFRHSLLSYDLIIIKLGRAKMFPEMEQLLHKLHHETRFRVPEPLFCHVISFYGQARLPARAARTFRSIPSFRCNPTLKSFNSLLNALLNCREFHLMTQLLSTVHHFGTPDACTYNILINAWFSIGDVERAYKVFDEMRKRGVRPNVVTFGTLINGLCKNSRLHEAFKVKEDMVKVFKFEPSVSIYTKLIKGVCEIGEFDWAFRIKEEMVMSKLRLDATVYNTLVSALFKARRKEEGLRVLEEMKKSGCRADSVTCNVVIGEFCREKNFEEAYRVLDGMEGLKQDVISYNVIIGWLCKEGKWREAIDLFEDMPRRQCAPDVVTHRTLFDGLCDWMQFREAAFVLDEMVFKGYVPLSRSLNKFVDGLSQEENSELLSTVLSCLGRGNCFNEDLWKIVVSMVCKPEKLSEPFELLDALVLG